MIKSELLDEKYKVQKRLSKMNLSIKDYLKQSHDSALKISNMYGFTLQYVKLPNQKTVSLFKHPTKDNLKKIQWHKAKIKELK